MLRAETENVRAAREGAKNMMRQALPRSQRGALTPPSWHLSGKLGSTDTFLLCDGRAVARGVPTPALVKKRLTFCLRVSQH